ncbi:ATP-binding protein [Arachidicoccus ginsenosidivorans]|uniref:AAA family ATPase n=1 Tax=Arachidicoccus ginsenosidivorans TaxID=496057 RepID=A0A5B8VPZ9_9BACT|nr:ATP-binding protein [Arachidicoccus ginsenosidivorans]QEC72338.1 AAA family ATPase [Arachidicoccus ginsenosidivorans]
MLRKYPISLQSFRKIRQGDYVYIDKTEVIHQIVDTDQYYFLSRPRRFGKSLLIDTINELFNGSKALFEGLWIYDKWDWSVTNPVIRFSFSNMGIRTAGLETAIYVALEENANRLGIPLTKKEYDLRFKELIEKAAIGGPVVILIDEYDKPIIDFLEDPGMVDANRSVMKNFYSILKDSDEHIRFLLITGVSQFSQVSIFSDLNNLRNITLSSQFGDIVGITQQELETNFSQEIARMQIDRPDILSQIKQWYDGYTWNMQTWVYNPFSLLNFMDEPIFRNYWYATGTPTFLLKQLKKKAIYDVEDYEMGGLALASFDTNHPDVAALLFQTGYLTIKNIDQNGQELYKLGFPNLEVKSSLLNGLLSIYRAGLGVDSLSLVAKINKALNTYDIEGLILQLNAMFAETPYDRWKADTESIFHIITYLTFKLAGVNVYTEVHSAMGRSDIMVKTDLYIYVLELKLDSTAAVALQQIKDKAYLAPYASDSRKKIAVGISFSSKDRKVEQFQFEEL